LGGVASRIIYGAEGRGHGWDREGKGRALESTSQVFDAGIGEVWHQAIGTLPALTAKGICANDRLINITVDLGMRDSVEAIGGDLGVRCWHEGKDEAGQEAANASN